MTVATPPCTLEIEPGDLERRVAALEAQAEQALIEEARRRAQRRRQRNGAAALLIAAAGAAAFFGFGGHGGNSVGRAAPADGSGAGAQPIPAPPTLAALPAGVRPSAFAFDPTRPNTVYVTSTHDSRGVYVYKTTDNGRHWRPTGAQGAGWISDILSLTADPLHPGTLYAGTNTAVYKTVDGGHAWSPSNRGLFPPEGGRPACYRVAGVGKRYCVSKRVGVPGTPSWGRNNGYVLDVSLDPVRSNVVYSAASAVHKSADGGRTWKAVFEPTRWGSDAGATRIAIAPTRPQSLYVIAHDHDGRSAIYKSANAGRTWWPTGGSASTLPNSCCGDSTDALLVDPIDPQKLYAAVGGTVLTTTNGGTSWQPRSTGLPATGVSSLAADPRRAGTVYASVEISHTSKTAAGYVEKPTGGIYKTIDGGQTWNEVFAASGIEKVAVNPAQPSTVYATGWTGRDPTHQDTFSLLRSTDGGRSWATAPAVPSRPTETTCLIAWNSPFNQANHDRITGSGPWSRSSLRPGVVGTVDGAPVSFPAKTVAKACLLLLADSGRHQLVTGIWSDSSVTHWSFGRPTKTHDAPTESNVKVLADGRVTRSHFTDH